MTIRPLLPAALLAFVLAQPAWAQAPQPPGPPPQQGQGQGQGQGQPPAPPPPQGGQGQGPQHGRPPPPHAYTDCKGKRPGDKVQHATPQGTVPATCENSPEGLVARPERQPQRQ